jgi:hypothetical protein
VAEVPAGEPGVPAAGADRGQAPGRLSRLARLLDPRTGQGAAAWILVALAAAAFYFNHKPRHELFSAVPDVLRALIATVVVFGIGGLGLVRLLLPAPLRRHEPLWVLPTGGCAVGVAMTVLGFAAVPYPASLAIVLVGGVALGVFAVRRRGWPALDAHELAWPMFLGAVVLAVGLIPVISVLHYAAPVGTGSDAHVAAGAANFLQHAYPTSVDTSAPINQMPPTWQSKFPIYYAFAGVSTVSGLATWQVLPVLAAVLLALAAVGLFLFARDVLGMTLAVAAVAMMVAGLDRLALWTVLNPYFNQTWGWVTLPFTLVLGWWAVQPGLSRHARRAAVGLLALFALVLVLAYPLAAPIPLVPIVVFALLEWRRRIAAGERTFRPRSLYRGARSLLWIVPAAALLAIPVAGAVDKGLSALNVLLPGHSLNAWGGDLGRYLPFNYALSLPSSLLYLPLLVAILGLAAYGLSFQHPSLKWGLGGLLAVGLLLGVYFRQRAYGWYFEFKLLAFIGPLVLLMAVVGASRLRRFSVPALAGLGLAALSAAFLQIYNLGYQLPQATIQLSGWARSLPAHASIRLDMWPPQQLWGAYFLDARPLCSQLPLLGTDYPHVAPSRKADYIVALRGLPRPADAVGPVLRENDGYLLYRENPVVPGPSNCTTRRFDRIYSGKGYSRF